MLEGDQRIKLQIAVLAFCMQIGLKMKAGDCPPLNMNAMHNISVTTVLKF